MAHVFVQSLVYIIINIVGRKYPLYVPSCHGRTLRKVRVNVKFSVNFIEPLAYTLVKS